MAEKPEDELKQIKEEEEKEFKWIIKEFYIMKKILKLINEAEDNLKAGKKEDAHKNLKQAFRKMRKEERAERRMARVYSRMLEHIKGNWEFLSKEFPAQAQEIKELLEKAQVYNADLEKLNSRGGELDKLLEEAKEDPSKLDQIMSIIKEDIKDMQAFEEDINLLRDKYKEILRTYKAKQKEVKEDDLFIGDFSFEAKVMMSDPPVVMNIKDSVVTSHFSEDEVKEGLENMDQIIKMDIDSAHPDHSGAIVIDKDSLNQALKEGKVKITIDGGDMVLERA